MAIFDLKIIEKYETIVFGPFIGELGWEIFRWSAFVRWYKKQYPNKKIIVYTRPDRTDLYYGLIDKIHSFIIKDDYNKFCPNMYVMNPFPKEFYSNLIKEIKEKYPKAFILEPIIFIKERNAFDHKWLDFTYTPHSDNKKILDKTINNKKIIPIVFAPRYRNDLIDKPNWPARNWPKENWDTLFTMFEEIGGYMGYIAGKNGSMLKPPKKLKNFIVLEDIVKEHATLIGLSIEAIYKSKLTIGSQSAIPLLSNLLKTPTIMWGHEQIRHQKNENLYNTPCTFIQDMKYKCNPDIIYMNALKILKKDNNDKN